MTESQIERQVELRTNSLDRQFLAGELTQKQYDKAIKQLDAWATKEYRRLGA